MSESVRCALMEEIKCKERVIENDLRTKVDYSTFVRSVAGLEALIEFGYHNGIIYPLEYYDLVDKYVPLSWDRYHAVGCN